MSLVHVIINDTVLKIMVRPASMTSLWPGQRSWLWRGRWETTIIMFITLGQITLEHITLGQITQLKL